MPLIAVSSVSEAQTASRFALDVLSNYGIIQNPVDTAILNDCRDRYDIAAHLSAVPRDSTPALVCFMLWSRSPEIIQGDPAWRFLNAKSM